MPVEVALSKSTIGFSTRRGLILMHKECGVIVSSWISVRGDSNRGSWTTLSDPRRAMTFKILHRRID